MIEVGVLQVSGLAPSSGARGGDFVLVAEMPRFSCASVCDEFLKGRTWEIRLRETRTECRSRQIRSTSSPGSCVRRAVFVSGGRVLGLALRLQMEPIVWVSVASAWRRWLSL